MNATVNTETDYQKYHALEIIALEQLNSLTTIEEENDDKKERLERLVSEWMRRPALATEQKIIEAKSALVSSQEREGEARDALTFTRGEQNTLFVRMRKNLGL